MDEPFAITLKPDSAKSNKTGTWRVERPEYRNALPPCNHACPAGENIQRWLYFAEEGNYQAAWEALMVDNPFPAIMGRVCYHPCETMCNRATLDEAVGINAIERFLGDSAIEHAWQQRQPTPTSGFRILVVGAGPAGLSAAYHLHRMGHTVVVQDAAKEPGGMLRYGIPQYRLPRDILDAEIQRLVDMGITMLMETSCTDIAKEKAAGHYDAVYVAVGAQLPHRIDIPAPDTARIIDALALLRSTTEDHPMQLGRRVAVYGGGNTAMDAARTAVRLGAQETIIVYRRTQEQMPAHEEELQQAKEEGVQVHWLSTIQRINGEELVLEKMTLDERGRPVATGTYETLDADCVVLALGQESDIALLNSEPGVHVHDGKVAVDARFMSGEPGIFAGGDVIEDEKTVTSAIGNGKHAAKAITAWLNHEEMGEQAEQTIAVYDLLNTWYYDDAPRALRPTLERARRVSTFDEVQGGLDEATALFEARRCFSCGNCFSCDNCFGICPDNAVFKTDTPDHPYGINLDYCKGCGMCQQECPCGAITMVPEDL